MNTTLEIGKVSEYINIEIPPKTDKIILNIFANKMASDLLMRLLYK